MLNVPTLSYFANDRPSSQVKSSYLNLNWSKFINNRNIHNQDKKKRTTKPEKEKRKQKEKERRKSLRKKEKKTQRKTKYKSSSKDYISQLPIIKIEFHHIQHFKTHTTFYPPSSNLKEDSFSSIYQL